ncbi:zincin-like metallopeptidase domain-containing protein [Pedobacter sp. GR22-6]|uniref:zincin-like metallopeptidase domain-containing protein n=1 Tax=Pedobacter sp. GR22-6 TaxID=3127957 RepID=UPI00307E80EE
MSNYKPFHEKVAELFIKNLESENSIFRTQPAYRPALFQTPVNASTGKNYRGMNAIWLAMQGQQDPRWMTMNQANKMQIKIPKGTSATMINIVKTAETFPMLDDEGKRIKDEHGKARFTTIPLETPTEETHWLFNAAQLAITQDAKLNQQPETGIDRLNKFIAAAGIEIVASKKNVEGFDRSKDQITLPKSPDHYETKMDYAAAVLLQLTNWTAHPDRLNRTPAEEISNADYVAEQLSTGIATVMLASETGISKYPTKHFERFIPEWINMIKAEPAVLAKAVNEAQKITDYVLEAESKLGLRKDLAQKPMRLDLFVGDQINYNHTTYKVLDRIKGDRIKIEDVNSGAKIPISPADGLYRSLVQAKYRGDKPAVEIERDTSKVEDLGNDLNEERSENKNLKR